MLWQKKKKRAKIGPELHVWIKELPDDIAPIYGSIWCPLTLLVLLINKCPGSQSGPISPKKKKKKKRKEKKKKDLEPVVFLVI